MQFLDIDEWANAPGIVSGSAPQTVQSDQIDQIGLIDVGEDAEEETLVQVISRIYWPFEIKLSRLAMFPFNCRHLFSFCQSV